MSRIERVKRTGFVLAAPAIMKFQFMNPARKAAMPTNAPMMRATPISISP